MTYLDEAVEAALKAARAWGRGDYVPPVIGQVKAAVEVPEVATYYEDKGRKALLGNYDVDAWENPQAIDIALGRVNGHVEHDINCGIPNPADPDQSSRCNCGAESAVGQLDEVIGEALIAAEDKGRSEERERLLDEAPTMVAERLWRARCSGTQEDLPGWDEFTPEERAAKIDNARRLLLAAILPGDSDD